MQRPSPASVRPWLALLALAVMPQAGCHPQLFTPPDGTTPALEEPMPAPVVVLAPPPETNPDVLRGPPVADFRREPQLRIRIQADLAGVTIGRGATLISTGTTTTPHAFTGPLQVTRQGDGFALTDAKGRRWTWAAATLVARAPQGAMAVGGQTYHGTVELTARGQRRMDLINDLPLETYLPGVLAKELYASWQPEAFRAQAIAARSYAIWEMTLRRAEGKTFDLEAGEASQAYAGATDNPKANWAVTASRGVVLTYDDRVLPAFFSACSGGATQDAVVAFPGRVADLPPLRGRATDGAETLCPRFDWPAPIERDKADAVRRLAAWGAAQKQPVAALRSLIRARVSMVSRAKRPAVFELTDADGRVFTLACEDFRTALNGGSPAVAPADRLPSSFCQARVAGDRLVLENGHGHGHGVGMAQWGAEGMAKAGYQAEAILDRYYPGAVLKRAY